ncbi:MAG: glycosyl transferase group 1 [Verrucomicrobiales bacterium]|nr:glycosyl transferase group 1 [Verrucomicrobiales bacterium]
MYCGNCFRDNAMVAELRKLGHETLMVPLYLPMTLEEEDQSTGTPIFFSGINVYLEQKIPFFRHAPNWLHKLLASEKLLNLAGKQAAKTRAEDVGDLTLSMLRGEEGNQARELDELIAFLKSDTKPDVVCLSNAMLVGFARKLKSELGCLVVCQLQGEDAFLDSMHEADRKAVWATLTERASDVDLFIAPSQYFADNMARRLSLPTEQLAVVYNGINLEGYLVENPSADLSAPVLGYFARMCEEKGLHLLVETFIELKRREATKHMKLKVGGGCGPGDQKYVDRLRSHLCLEGVLKDVSFHPNLDRPAKQEFLKSLSIFSVPALYGEAFGLYLAEAMAAGVPVVQPRHAAFPEIVDVSGAGLVAEPNAGSLADEIEKLLGNENRFHALQKNAVKTAKEKFNVGAMARSMVETFEKASLTKNNQPVSA